MDIPEAVFRMNPILRFGIARGRHEGKTELVLSLLTKRLGPIPPRQAQAIRKLALRRVEQLGEALLGFQTRSDLSRWLKSHPK
jgi:hypothetical protein